MKSIQIKKIIIWAHNTHVEENFPEGYNSKLMGHYLKEKYKEDYYSLGLFTYEGKAYQFWIDNMIHFKNDDSTAIENRFFKTGKTAAFLDLSGIKLNQSTQWLFETNTAFELENGGTTPFIPIQRSDGILSVKFSKTPTYD